MREKNGRQVYEFLVPHAKARPFIVAEIKEWMDRSSLKLLAR